MKTSAISSLSDLDRRVGEFEHAWRQRGKADLTAFLPALDHPDFHRIACELVCIDLEMRWSHGSPKNLRDYVNEFPQVFRERDVLREAAFEEYRQRVQAGAQVDPAEYRERFGVDVGGWPEREEALPLECVERTQVVNFQPVVNELARTTEARAAIVQAVSEASPKDGAILTQALDSLPGCGERLFGFELVQELGEGAFAKVFLAHQLELGNRPTALKVAPTLNDEPRKLARLQHTNIVPIYSTHQSGRLHAVCMPYLGSLTLQHLLNSFGKRPGSLPESGRDLLSTLFDKHSTTVERGAQRSLSAPLAPTECAAATPILDMMTRFSHIEAVLWIGARIADALAHAHERGILHLDLKPANILLTDDGQPMLLDFNLSIDLNSLDPLEMGRLGGTLSYMSTEQLNAFAGGKRDLDCRSDLYSLGVILFELLTGTSPFPRRLGRMSDVVKALRQDRGGPVPSARARNPAIPAAVEAIIRKLLEPDRVRRYQNAVEVREDFERQLADLPLKHAADRSVVERAGKWRRRHPRTAAAVLVAAVAGVFFLMPATVLAVRESQIAERKKQVETAEAQVLWQQSRQESCIVQVLLATRTGERATLDAELERGKDILERYEIDSNPGWTTRPFFARLSPDEQRQARLELGEMLLFMARGEELRATDAKSQVRREQGLRAALRWNELAANCYPPVEAPRMLGEQRVNLVKQLPRQAEAPEIRPRQDGKAAEFDAYHDGVDRAMAGRCREALEKLLPFTDAHPRHFQSWYVRGVCHDNLEENAEAVACWTACIALNPEMPHAYFNRGLIRLRQSDFAQAERDFTRALERKPGWPEALMDRAIARKGLKKYAAAVKDLDEVIAPNSTVRARFLRAEIKELNKQAAEAKADFDEAMIIRPDDELGWSTRGFARLSTAPVEALKDFNEAIARNPRSRDALINKSIALSEFLDRPREAVEVLDRFLDYYPDHVGARLGRGVVLARLGECQRARRDAEHALQHDRSPFFLFQAAGLYAQISRHDTGGEAKLEAIALLRAALQKGFDDLELFKNDHDLDPVRGEADFKRLLDVVAGLKNSPSH